LPWIDCGVVCPFNTAVTRFIGYFPGHLFGRT
jgi:hypothetical protein